MKPNNKERKYQIAIIILTILFSVFSIGITLMDKPKEECPLCTCENTTITRIVNQTIYVPTYKEIVPAYMRLDKTITTGNLHQTADKLWKMSGSPAQYAALVELAVRDNIQYRTDGTGAITNAETAWNIKRGDCSEFALIMVEMLKYKGIQAEYIHGDAILANGTNLGSHARVEITYQLDASDIPVFRKAGNGLLPEEYIR